MSTGPSVFQWKCPNLFFLTKPQGVYKKFGPARDETNSQHRTSMQHQLIHIEVENCKGWWLFVCCSFLCLFVFLLIVVVCCLLFSFVCSMLFVVLSFVCCLLFFVVCCSLLFVLTIIHRSKRVVKRPGIINYVIDVRLMSGLMSG